MEMTTADYCQNCGARAGWEGPYCDTCIAEKKEGYWHTKPEPPEEPQQTEVCCDYCGTLFATDWVKLVEKSEPHRIKILCEDCFQEGFIADMEDPGD